MWKILKAQIREKINYSLISHGIFPNKQKGCYKRTRRTGELLCIDQRILNESETRRINLAMAWIDYKEAYDMVPQIWILNSLKMYKIPDQVQFIEKTTQTWRVKLTVGGKSLAVVKIQRGMFQVDVLSPLLFVKGMMPLNPILRKCTNSVNRKKRSTTWCTWTKNQKELETLIQTVRIYGQDIGMEYGIEKGAMLEMKSGKWHMTEGIELSEEDDLPALKTALTDRYNGSKNT